MNKRFLISGILFLAAVGGGMAQSLSLGEHLVLRGGTGKAFGQVLAQNLGLKSLHILTNNTSIRAGLVGAMGASYLDLEGQRQLKVTTFVAPEEVPPLKPQEEAVALIFGGQATPEVNYGLTKNALKALVGTGHGGQGRPGGFGHRPVSTAEEKPLFRHLLTPRPTWSRYGGWP